MLKKSNLPDLFETKNETVKGSHPLRCAKVSTSKKLLIGRDFWTTIARYALGNDARGLSQSQMEKFIKVYSVYVSHKYGRRFREFIGGKIVVQKSRPIKSFFEVETLAHLKGWEPFTVSFLVSNRSGKLLFFNMFIEGINMLLTERTEIGAMSDKRRGDIEKVMKDLQNSI